MYIYLIHSIGGGISWSIQNWWWKKKGVLLDWRGNEKKRKRKYGCMAN
jgi:hypothetical protein